MAAEPSEAAPPAAPAGLGQRIVRGTFNYGLGRILPQVVGFLLVPVYTAYLSPEDYGVLDMLTSFGSMLFILMRLGVGGAVTRFYYDHKEGPDLRNLITTVGWFQVFASLGIGAIAIAAWPIYAPKTLPGIALLPLGALVVVTQVLAGNSDIQRRLIQAREQSAYSAKLSLANATVQIVLAIVFIVGFKMSVLGMLLSFHVAGVLFFIQAIAYLKPDLSGRYDRSMMRPALLYAVGILPSQLIGELSPVATRALLANVDGVYDVGVLAIATKFASPLAIVVSAFATAYLPIYFAARKDPTEENVQRIAGIARTVWIGFLIFGVGVALMGPPAIRILTPERFHAAAPLVPVVAAFQVVQIFYTLASPEIFYSQRTWLVPLISLANAAVTVGLTVLWVKPYGAAGVSWATTCGLLVSSGLAAATARRMVKVPYRWKRAAVMTVIASAAIAVSFKTAGMGAWSQAGVNAAISLGFVAILYLTKDPALFEAVTLVKRRLGGGKRRS
ncbi:MAG: oligosaccharide flippase family protein [Myxococcaceae bacterium]